jgi:hypothetical protein
MEHIAAAEDYIRSLIIEKVKISPAAPGRDIVAIDAAILTGVPDRTVKRQAPEPIKPTNRFATPQGSIDHFVESRAKTEEFLKTTPDSANTPQTVPPAQSGMLMNLSC